jgi:branched-chain amino acid transport system substrate-binding protein
VRRCGLRRRIEGYELPAKPTDVSSVLGSVRSTNPDLLVCVMHDQNSLLVARQMVATNTNVKLLVPGPGPAARLVPRGAGQALRNISAVRPTGTRTPFKDKFFGDSKKFAEYYRSKFTRPIAYHVAGAAACIETYVLAMQAAKSVKPEAVRDALAVADYETFYSRIKFTPEGDGDELLMGGMIGQVQKGKLEIVFPAAAASAKPLYPAPTWDKKA